MVLKVTRLRRRGLTSRCARPPEPFGEPFDEPLPAPFVAPFAKPSAVPFCPPFGLPIFEKQARMAAGGKAISADRGYSPRSASSIADGIRSLPIVWIDQFLVPC